MSLQEIYDAVWNGLESQGFAQSVKVDEYGVALCQYRGPGGAKCAAGWLIPDENYDKDYEGDCASGVLYLVQKFSDRSKSMSLINDLQSAHDGTGDPDSMLDCVDYRHMTPEIMKARLNVVAEHYGLEAK